MKSRSCVCSHQAVIELPAVYCFASANIQCYRTIAICVNIVGIPVKIGKRTETTGTWVYSIASERSRSASLMHLAPVLTRLKWHGGVLPDFNGHWVLKCRLRHPFIGLSWVLYELERPGQKWAVRRAGFLHGCVELTVDGGGRGRGETRQISHEPLTLIPHVYDRCSVEYGKCVDQ